MQFLGRDKHKESNCDQPELQYRQHLEHPFDEFKYCDDPNDYSKSKQVYGGGLNNYIPYQGGSYYGIQYQDGSYGESSHQGDTHGESPHQGGTHGEMSYNTFQNFKQEEGPFTDGGRVEISNPCFKKCVEACPRYGDTFYICIDVSFFIVFSSK